MDWYYRVSRIPKEEKQKEILIKETSYLHCFDPINDHLPNGDKLIKIIEFNMAIISTENTID